MGHYIYKYVLDNEIIYIGKTDNILENRLYQHGRTGDNIAEEYWDDINKADIFYAPLPNRTITDVLETDLIHKYKPRCNSKIDHKMKCDWDGLDMPEPKWRNFDRKNLVIIRNGKAHAGNSFVVRMEKAHPNAFTPTEITAEVIKRFIEGETIRQNNTFIWLTNINDLTTEFTQIFIDSWGKASADTAKSYVIFEINNDHQPDFFELSFELKSPRNTQSARAGKTKIVSVKPKIIRYEMPSIALVKEHLLNPTKESIDKILESNTEYYKEKELEETLSYYNAEFNRYLKDCLFVEIDEQSHVLHYRNGKERRICWISKKYSAKKHKERTTEKNIICKDKIYENAFVQMFTDMGIPHIKAPFLKEKNGMRHFREFSENKFDLDEFLAKPCSEDEYRWAYTRNDFRSKVLSFIESDLSNNGGSKEDKDFNRLKSTYKINGTKQHDMSDNEFRLLIGAL